MKKEDFRYFKIIGKIQNRVSKAETFDSALKEGLKIILEESVADCAVLWYQTDGGERIRPFYWICPADLTSYSFRPGEGIIGRVCQSQKSEMIADFSGSQEDGDRIFYGKDITSVLCVPLSVGDTLTGCVEFMKAGESGASFQPEDADVCEMLCMFMQIAIEEVGPLPESRMERSVLMSVRDVKKTYRSGDIEYSALKGVSLDIFEGEFLCLLGESGCGKSTMLNIIGGLLDATEGSILYQGKDLCRMNEKELMEYRRDNVGFVFQAYNLMPNLNARQNLDLIAELVDKPLDSESVLSLVKMGEKKNSYPSELSGGQQQRVSIARAIVKNPKLILADEPTAALDYETSVEVLSIFQNIVKNGTTLVMVTHNEEITRMADRVIRFRGGRTYEVTVNRHPVDATELKW